MLPFCYLHSTSCSFLFNFFASPPLDLIPLDCDRKNVEGLLSKSRPSWTAQIPGNKITPPRRMVLLVSPWHSFEHTQYSTLGFTPKSQNRANVVAVECLSVLRLFRCGNFFYVPTTTNISFFLKTNVLLFTLDHRNLTNACWR